MRTTRILAAAVLAAATSVFVAAPAFAAPGAVSVGADGVVYYAGTESNNVVIVRNLTATTVDVGVPGGTAPTAGPGCVPTSSSATFVGVACTFGGPTPTVDLDFGAGKDLCDCKAPVVYHIDFGPGDDKLHYLNGAFPATILGGGGDDHIFSGTASDSINGGGGFDIVSYGGRQSSVVANLTTGSGGVSPESDTYQSIEGLYGGSGNDVLTGDGGPNELEGDGGHDSIFGEGGDDVLGAGYGAYHLVGTTAVSDDDDTLHGGPGNDTVTYYYHGWAPVFATLNSLRDDGTSSHNEKDLIEPDVENLHGTRAADVLVGDAGPNKLHGLDPVKNSVTFEDGGDWLIGEGGNDTIFGYKGDDLLLGGAGNDRLIGGLGKDTMHGDDGVDVAGYETHDSAVNASLDGAANDGAGAENDLIGDTVENLGGSKAADTLLGNDGPNVIDGDPPAALGLGGGADVINAGGGNDTVNAGPGDDHVIGGTGNDTLNGQAGNDLLDGGPGTDTCNVGANGGTTVNCSP